MNPGIPGHYYGQAQDAGKGKQMATAIQNKFHWNEEHSQWERVDRVQQYKGHEIATITYHYDWLLTVPDNHRMYRITFPSGRVSSFNINKRGGNIKSLKEWIDFNIENDRKEFL